MVRLHPQLGSADGVLVGSTIWALWVGAWSAKIRVLAVASFSFFLYHNQFPKGQALQILL